MPIKQLKLLGGAALLLAWSFDLLFWEKIPGISFLIFVLLCLGAGLLLTWKENLLPPVTSWLLIVPILFFAWMSFVRAEPFTLMIDYGLALGGIYLLTVTWLGGRWWQYNLTDHLHNALVWTAGLLAKPVQHFLPLFRPGQKGGAEGGENSVANGAAAGPARGRPVLSVLLGILLALPLVTLLAGLLAEADPVFSQQLNALLEFLNIENLTEYIFRLTYILIFAYLLAGALIYALVSSREEKLKFSEQPWLKPFLSWYAALPLLVSVNLLFAFFVAVQFRYFFGGQANINLAGYTYAEYTRRGFGELVAVALISLALYLGLSMVTQRAAGRQRRSFSALGISLVLLVGVILVSAFQRLLLYEAAYGFTRLRTYTHIFMLWLGVLLVAVAVLEGFGRLRYFALVGILSCLGFGLTLNLLNVDAFVVHQNVSRTLQGEPLDVAYLAELSYDAVPALAERFDDQRLPQAARSHIGAILACGAALDARQTEPLPWQSFLWSRHNARQLYQEYQAKLAAYTIESEDGFLRVNVNGALVDCQDYSWSYD